MQDSLRPTLHPELSYKFYNVGSEQTPLLVIDNFIQDAPSLVEYCAENTKFSKVDNFYPGLRMVAPTQYIHAINRYLAELLSNIFGLTQDKIAGGKALYSMVVTPPDQLEITQCLPHIDSYLSGDLACVHFLCDKEKGGTSLYRHRKTGYEKITSENIDHYKQSVVEEGALKFDIKSYMNGSNAYFEQIASVDAMFNRMIIYPSNILHSGNIAPDFNFDPNPISGRLTLNSFIYCKRTS
ncbi:MAG: DUF6445 family protein [Cellvibrio sp.]|uniref:DUF6445 family protein n=1 Tax=Cellvibrio sp. TaxID=1965322 RepID=UPI00272773BE|nr:DUF6445 family protein [Cellvibrio sp.]